MPRRSKKTKWIDIFLEFIEGLRIDSKEETAASGEDEGGTPLDLWESQRRFLEELASGLEENVRVFVCLKSRQLGVTTISLAIDLFWMAMYPGTRGALVVDSEDNREEFRGILRRYLASFPADYFGEDFKLVTDNKFGQTYSNGSRLTFLVAGKSSKKVNWGEGKGFSFAHLSEMSKYGSAEGVKNFEEAFAQKNPNRLMIIESTANGMNHYRDRWLEAKADVHTQRAFFVGWWASKTNRIEKSDPRFAEFGTRAASGNERELVQAVAQQYKYKISPEQLAWYRWREWKDSQSEADQVRLQNQPWTEHQAFIATGFSFFQMRRIGQDLEHIYESGDPQYQFLPYRYELGNNVFALKLEQVVTEEERNRIELRVWEEPVAGAEYVLGMDPAYGRNEHKDRTAISVWRCFADKIVQVAEFASADLDPNQSAWVLAHLAGSYSDCVVIVELGGPGRMIMPEWNHVVGMMKSEMYAPEVAARQWDNALDNIRWYLYHRPDAMGPGYAYNFETTSRTKQEIMHGLRGSYTTSELVIRSAKLLEEMRLVVQTDSGIGAPESRNEDSKDDRVIAAALCWRAWVDWRRASLMARGITYANVLKEESGEVTQGSKVVNNIVFKFLKTQEEKQAMAVEAGPPQWMRARGLA